MAGDPITKSSWFPTDPNVDPTDLGGPEGTDPRRGKQLRPSLVRLWSPADTATVIFPLDSETVDLGRGVTGPDDIRIRGDGRVSRRHARITVEASGVLLEDRSAHGTLVNGQPIQSTPLVDGDLVRTGDTFFLFRLQPVPARDATIPGILGGAPSVRYLRAQIELIAPSVAWVLLLGETGSGKEVTARALHTLSGRGGPFVAVNCSAITETLAESQLFGHKRGAFTGADRDYAGYFEQADGGTLFLDELGELSPALQPKLLRALDEQRITRVGEREPRAVDVRVVAATNRDLSAAMKSGDFRSDLYARLADITLQLPPLRARREDVIAILLRFLELPDPKLSPELVDLLLLHDWPHNVRELRKVATELNVRGVDEPVLGRRLVADRFGLGAAPEPETHPPVTEDPDGPTARNPAPAPAPALTREVLTSLLERHHGNVAEVARELDRSRRQVYRLLEKHELSADDYRRSH